MIDNSSEIDDLLDRTQAGDERAQAELFERYRERLKRMVQLRMDRRLIGRIDASDVLQEAFLEASQRLNQFLGERKVPLFIWLRFLVGRRLSTLHRYHLGTQIRDAGREISLWGGPVPSVSSAAIAAQLVGKLTSPSQVVMRAERVQRIQAALNSMDEIDREVLSLRYFEELSNSEAATVLGIDESAASNRSVRALKRLKQLIDDEM